MGFHHHGIMGPSVRRWWVFYIYILVIDAVILCLLFSTDYTMYVYILMYIYVYIYMYIYMWFFKNWMLNPKNSLASMVLEVF